MSGNEYTLEQYLFLSDVHIGAFGKDKNQLIEDDLIALIHHCYDENIHIVILGDLFDYWMEYPKYNFVPDIGRRVLEAFQKLNSKLGPSLFITGNHDHWTFGHFKDRGFDVEHSHRVLSINNQRVLLTHGDGTLNGAYNLKLPFLNKVLKNRLFTSLFQLFTTPQFGLSVMKRFSKTAKLRNIIDAHRLDNWAESCLTENEIDVIIAGDDHIPRLETLSYGTYINTGTFFDHRTVALYTNNEFKLVTWNAGKQLFSTYTP